MKKEERPKQPAAVYTDCRDDVGITVGLIDSLITICRVLADRELYYDEVQEALKDLSADEDFRYIIAEADRIEVQKSVGL